jgi:DtxR family Mn-dependent transcriptional regulator
MLQKLAASTKPLVEYERHRGVLLSEGGMQRALEVLRHHRLYTLLVVTHVNRYAV